MAPPLGGAVWDLAHPLHGWSVDRRTCRPSSRCTSPVLADTSILDPPVSSDCAERNVQAAHRVTDAVALARGCRVVVSGCAQAQGPSVIDVLLLPGVSSRWS